MKEYFVFLVKKCTRKNGYDMKTLLECHELLGRLLLTGVKGTTDKFDGLLMSTTIKYSSTR